jgi:hypothetical protein
VVGEIAEVIGELTEVVGEVPDAGMVTSVVVLIIIGQLVVKLNEALASGHLRALVMTKFWHVFHYGVLNVYLIILLIKYSINSDASVPLWRIGRPLMVLSPTGQAWPSTTLSFVHS